MILSVVSKSFLILSTFVLCHKSSHLMTGKYKNVPVDFNAKLLLWMLLFKELNKVHNSILLYLRPNTSPGVLITALLHHHGLLSGISILHFISDKYIIILYLISKNILKL